jgi:hypothetical protein
MSKGKSRLTVNRRKRASGPTLSDAQIGKVCGVTRQSAHNWHKEGLKKQPTLEQLAYWLAHRQGYAPESQRERLAKAQAEKVELENRRRSGQLIEISIVSEVFASLAADLANRHDGVAGRTAGEFAGMNDKGAIRQRLLAELRGVRDAVAAAIEELADALGGTEEVRADTEVATAEDAGPVGGPVPDPAGRKR